MNVGKSLTAKERVTYSSGDFSLPPELRLLHFNDGKLYLVETLLRFVLTM